MKLAITGAALSAGLASWTTGLLLADRRTMESFRFWQVGTIGGRGFDVLVVGLPFLVVGALLALAGARLLNTLALGDDLARGLGRRTTRDRLVIALAIVLLAGTATALAGPIAFVGLVVPHVVRALVGPDHARVLPFSMLAGAALVVVADTVGRVVLPPSEVQVGIMAAAVGVPVFLAPGPTHREGDVSLVLDRPRTAAARTARPSTSYAAPAGRRRRHRRQLLAGLGLAVVGAFAVRVLLGDYTVTVPDFVRILGGEQIPGATYIVMESKLPRAVLAVLVGLAFGVGGAIFQTTLRNPLASPDIVGVSLGASAAAVSAIALAGWTGWSVSLAAVAGALGVGLAVRAVAGDRGGFRLVLAGIGLAAAMQSVIQYVFTRVDEWDVQLVLRWLTGSVNGVGWSTHRPPRRRPVPSCCPATGWAARSLEATELGDDTAAVWASGRAAPTC